MGFIAGQSGLSFGSTVVLADGFTSTATRYDKTITGMAVTTEAASASMVASMDRIKLGTRGLIFSIALAIPLILAANAAVKFETAFTGVRKTVEATEAEFDKLAFNIKGLSKVIPVAAVDLARIGELAGQLGVEGVNNLTKFISTIAQIAVTTNLTEELAATSFARISNIMQASIDDVDRLGSAIVELGNTFATTEQEITNFALRIAGGGKVVDASVADILGIGAAFTSVGVRAEVGGTAVQKVLLKMNTALIKGGDILKTFSDIAGLTIDQFRGLEPAERFIKFVEGLTNQGAKAALALEDLGLKDERLIRAFLSMANAGGLLREAVESSNKAFIENTALAAEAEKRFATVASQWQITKNTVFSLAETVGKVFLPVLKALNKAIQFTVDLFETIVDNPIGKIIIVTTGLIATFVAVVSLGNIAIGFMQIGLVALAAKFGLTGAAAAGAAPLVHMFGIALKIALGPIGLIILAITAFLLILKKTTSMMDSQNETTFKLGTALTLMLGPLGQIVAGYKLVNRGIKDFNDLTEDSNRLISGGILGTLTKLGGIIEGVGQIWASWNGKTFTLTKNTVERLQQLGLLDFVLNIGTHIIRVKQLFIVASDAMGRAFDSISDALHRLAIAIFPASETFEKFAGSIGKSKTPIEDVGKSISGFIDTVAGWVVSLIDFGVRVVNFFRDFATDVRIKGIGEALGEGFMNGMLEGLKAGWESIKTWFLNALNSLIPGFGIGSALANFFSSDDSDQRNKISAPSQGTPGAGGPFGLRNLLTAPSAPVGPVPFVGQGAAGGTSQASPTQVELTIEPTVTQIILDNEVMGEILQRWEARQKARS